MLCDTSSINKLSIRVCGLGVTSEVEKEEMFGIK